MSKEFDEFMKTVGKMTEEEWQAAERAQTSSQTEISDADKDITKPVLKPISESNPCKEIPLDGYFEQVEWYREQIRIRNEKK
jgi:hypothetical protein